jgi:hypothetical protein
VLNVETRDAQEQTRREKLLAVKNYLEEGALSHG